MADNSTIKRLRAYLNDSVLSPQEMDQHIKEMTGKNDRLVAVVCGASVEAALSVKLKKHMRPSAHDSLFGPKQPLSTFSAKINLAYALGLIDNDTRRNAHYIREIRNTFAHRLKSTRFTHAEVAAVCKLLLVGKRAKSKHVQYSMRKRYMFACLATGQAIWDQWTLQGKKIEQPASLEK